MLSFSIKLLVLISLANVGEAGRKDGVDVKIRGGGIDGVDGKRGGGRRRGKSCFVHSRVQKVAVRECSDQLIKIPICIGACSTSESLYINGVDVSRMRPGSNSACSCCRPVKFKNIKLKVPCYKLFYKELKLKIPVRCECDSNCSSPKDGVDEKLEIERKDFLTNSKGMPDSRSALYNMMSKV